MLKMKLKEQTPSSPELFKQISSKSSNLHQMESPLIKSKLGFEKTKVENNSDSKTKEETSKLPENWKFFVGMTCPGSTSNNMSTFQSNYSCFTVDQDNENSL